MMIDGGEQVLFGGRTTKIIQQSIEPDHRSPLTSDEITDGGTSGRFHQIHLIEEMSNDIDSTQDRLIEFGRRTQIEDKYAFFSQ